MIGLASWRQISNANFERLALEHVSGLYPEFRWSCTPLVSDGGKDAVGESRNLKQGVLEIYWMEAKHHPANRSIGKYTLDTHLISAFESHDVKRLHVVTSGLLSANFLVRADTFSREHGFVFAYSDQEALEAWLVLRPDLVHQYFGSASNDVVRSLESAGNAGRAVFFRALLTADNDGANPASTSVPHLLPGKKFRLILTTSAATRLNRSALPLQLIWEVPARVGLLRPASEDTEWLTQFNPFEYPVVSVPFRLLWFSSVSLPNPKIRLADRKSIIPVPLRNLAELPRLYSPFAGNGARRELLRLQRLLGEEVCLGEPRLVLCLAPAGAGKTRLSEELRDTAQTLEFNVRLVQMPFSVRGQQEHWRQLFRWFFGLEHNPFEIPEEELIRKRLARLELEFENRKFAAILARFLAKGVFSEELFDLHRSAGHGMADAVRAVVGRRCESKVLLHIDDAHHLSRRELRPLHLLRHLIETSDSLPLCLLVTGRNDETVRENSFSYFARSLHIAGNSRFQFIELPPMTLEDAQELVVTTLRWPELRAQESRTLGMIINRCGYNPFFLTQTLDHLAMDYETVAFGHGEDNRFLINIPAFKRALREVPRGAKQILSQRFSGLLRRGDRRLLEAIAAVAVIGRRAPRRIVSSAMKKPLTASEISRLLELGYISDVSDRHLELVHDLLVDALRERPEAQSAATLLAKEMHRKRHTVLNVEQQAAVYFAAGPRYQKQSWDLTRQIAEERFQRQEYNSIPPLLERLESISHESRAIQFDLRLDWIAASVQQHCGNTQVALDRFEGIREATLQELPQGSERYIDATIEVSQQYLLRAEPTLGIKTLHEALNALEEPALRLPPNIRYRLMALAHNRYGAALHLVDQRTKALEQFETALDLALKASDDYLYAHTHWNLAALLRFNDPVRAAKHLETARELRDRHLRHRERFRLMIESSEAYSRCLLENRAIRRAFLRAIAAEASGKGYLFQSCDALLSLVSTAMAVKSWDEAQDAAFRALDLTVSSEDIRSRAIATHYLSISAQMLGAEVACRDWCAEAARLLADPALATTTLAQCIRFNTAIASSALHQEPGNHVQRSGRLRWVLYDRI